MAWLAVKARMRILALGSKLKNHAQHQNVYQKDFTLMELMVVVAIIAIASVGVMFAFLMLHHGARAHHSEHQHRAC